MSKRPAGSLGSLLSTSARESKRTVTSRPTASASASANAAPANPFLARPTQPEEAIKLFLVQSRSNARRAAAAAQNAGKTPPPFEIEAKLGILNASNRGPHDMRVISGGAKKVKVRGVERIVNAFVCATPADDPRAVSPANRSNFEGGITRSNFLKWTGSGISEPSSLSAAFSCRGDNLKSQMTEREYVETVFAFPDKTRINFPHDPPVSNNTTKGNREKKEKVISMDVALPAAPYDLRMTLATESPQPDREVPDVSSLPAGWDKKRIKRRRSYLRTDRSFAWQIDVTEVTSSINPAHAASMGVAANHQEVGYEVEMELSQPMTQKLLQSDDASARQIAETLAKQLWYMITNINPTHDVLEVDEFLREHTDKAEIKLALGQCGSLRRFVDSKCQNWSSAIAPEGGPMGVSQPPRNFIGCMPVNFSRHNIEEVQRSDCNNSGDSDSAGYYLSEKTDGVRYLLVFTGKTAVLVDRASHQTNSAMQPKPRDGANGNMDPLSPIIPLVKPGCVLDGEVVVHRKLRRPLFIAFDVLAISASEPILHLPFEQRLKHLRNASFAVDGAKEQLFAKEAVMSKTIALPLVRKNFVKRVELDRLLSFVVEERGLRSYRNGDCHNHLTDGIIFQPNLPYACGTDVNLLKWKYLDTVTIDVQILDPRIHGLRPAAGLDEDSLRVGVMGEEGTIVDMTRFIRLPDSERRRLEADRFENGSNIAEVGFDPTTGEWYYLTMRPDKVAPNHITTVLGTMLELAESLSTEELRYRMSVPSGARDTYAKDVRNMQKQLLEHQRRKHGKR